MMHLHLLFAVWVLAAAAIAAASAAGQGMPVYKVSDTPTDALWDRLVSDSDQPYVSIIATISSRKLIQARFRHVCGQTPGSTVSTSVIDVPNACWSLQGACHRVFRSSIIGLAGRFTRQQLAALYECAGPEGLVQLTQDNQVQKAEGMEHKNWWTYRPPTSMTLDELQQLAASKLGTATASGVAAGVARANSALQVQASAGPANGLSAVVSNVTMTLIQRWILAEVGLAAQQQLSQPNMASQPTPQVRATDYVPTDSIATDSTTGTDTDTLGAGVPQVTAQVAADGAGGRGTATVSNQQPAGSKNQDPGIKVDPRAVAQPDIIVRTAGDSSSSRSDSSQDRQQPLPLAAAQQANTEPGVKEQRLVTALWNLDRIDQQQLPLNNTFSYGSSTAAGTGKGVTIYILDSGIRATHQEFQPWYGSSGSRVTVGPDFVDNDGAAEDCDGHGTHVASTAAGRSVGVAKEARVVAVRVLDCDGAGSISNVVAALDWVAENAVKPAVVSLSLGVPAGSWSKPIEDAIQHMTDVVGVHVIVASGNSAKDSCGVAPARAATALTVAASNMPAKFQQTRGDTENLYSWSNTGACVKLFAPGVDIYGACGGAARCATLDDASYTWASGTSMAAPHVTGAAAVYLESHPTATPAEVMSALLAASSTGHLTDPTMLPGTPNKLLFTGQQ